MHSDRHRRGSALRLGVGFGLLSALPAVAADLAEDLTPAWQLGAQGRFAEAAEALPAKGGGEDTQFTRAVLLFNRQPRTEADMVEAILVLSDLAAHGTTAELRARSLYFWASAETLRSREETPTEAIRLFERLWREFPSETYGQRALVHLLLLAFYAPEPRALLLEHCAVLIRQAGAITDPVVRSQLHQVAARGYLHLGGEDALALEQLLQVAALGVVRAEARGDLQVSIGQLAAGQGRPALAREYYTAFLSDFPNDPRAYTVRALLAALPAETMPPAKAAR